MATENQKTDDRRQRTDKKLQVMSSGRKSFISNL